jgi:hypothetical protein
MYTFVFVIFDQLLNADFDDYTGLSGSQRRGQEKGIYGKDDCGNKE